MELIMLARSNREIVREMGISTQAVTAHVSRLMRKDWNRQPHQPGILHVQAATARMILGSVTLKA